MLMKTLHNESQIFKNKSALSRLHDDKTYLCQIQLQTHKSENKIYLAINIFSLRADTRNSPYLSKHIVQADQNNGLWCVDCHLGRQFSYFGRPMFRFWRFLSSAFITFQNCLNYIFAILDIKQGWPKLAISKRMRFSKPRNFLHKTNCEVSF